MAGYVVRQLGGPQWNVELTKQQVLDCIQDAFSEYNICLPRIRYGSVRLFRNVRQYLVGEDVGTVVQVDFVDTLPAPTEVFYGNLISPAPLLRTGLDEYDSFMRWRRTWQRVMSVLPDWLYDQYEKTLYVHNPIERYHCGIVCHQAYPDVDRLDNIGAKWVKDYALAKARYVYGEVLAKFSGAIPAPLKDLQLDTQKRGEATAQLEKLLAELKGMQLGIGIITD